MNKKIKRCIFFILKNIFKYFLLFLIGGGAYVGIEFLYRSYSHWTMFILGGLCFILIGLLNEKLSWETPLISQSIIGGIIIIILEYITGCVVNLKLGWGIWDYSTLPFNLQGQICLPYLPIWILIASVAVIVDDYLRYWIFKEEKPHYDIV